ncbi:hypothetical protein EYF80_000262 [Liparis tanakae]|uniref:Uncharacterized protein n=1 Tax=Liparis tanakae TaxID=230148 RepID=A0A4Z2JH73_9TELE|nr:hypothetical protein EYF80_000262 [Liparis tanakae]
MDLLALNQQHALIDPAEEEDLRERALTALVDVQGLSGHGVVQLLKPHRLVVVRMGAYEQEQEGQSFTTKKLLLDLGVAIYTCCSWPRPQYITVPPCWYSHPPRPSPSCDPAS